MAENTVRAEKESGDNKEAEEDSYSLNRRDALKMSATAAAAGLTGLSAVTGSTAAATERHGISFDRVVNAVDDLGLDPDGDEPIDSAVEETIEEGDTLIEFPPGEYYWQDRISERDVNNWGIRGLGDQPTDVRFVSGEGASKHLLATNGGEGLLVENLSLDYSSDEEGSLGMVLKVDDDLRVQDVHYVGYNPTDNDGAVDNLSPQVLDSDGRAIVDGLVRTGPTDIRPHGENEGCIWLGDNHVGELVIRNSHIENTGTNAIYARAAPGDVKVEDSLFVNNNQTSLRIGGDGSHVKDCRFVVDTDEATEENDGRFINPNAILWETGTRGDTGGSIEGCDFVYKSVPSETIAVWIDGSAGEMTIRDNRFQLDAEVAAIRVDDPQNARLGTTADKPWNVTIDGVSVTGSSSWSTPAISITNRDGSTVKNSCLHLTGDRDGIRFRNSDDCSIEDTNINVGGEATIFRGSDVSTSGITNSDSCPAPGDSSSLDQESGEETETETEEETETETETETEEETETETETATETETGTETETETETATETGTEAETETATATETDDQ